VVKIQRPGIRRRVAADLQILKRFAQTVELAKLGRRFVRSRTSSRDFSDNLAEEAEFPPRGAVDGGVGFLTCTRRRSAKNIRVPQVYWDLTSERGVDDGAGAGHPHR